MIHVLIHHSIQFWIFRFFLSSLVTRRCRDFAEYYLCNFDVCIINDTRKLAEASLSKEDDTCVDSSLYTALDFLSKTNKFLSSLVTRRCRDFIIYVILMCIIYVIAVYYLCNFAQKN